MSAFNNPDNGKTKVYLRVQNVKRERNERTEAQNEVLVMYGLLMQQEIDVEVQWPKLQRLLVEKLVVLSISGKERREKMRVE